MGRTRKRVDADLGRSLVKTKKSTQGDKSAHEIRHNTYEEKTTALKSVTEESSYDEFIATAALAEKEFTAEKLNVKFVGMAVTSASTSVSESTLDIDPSEFLSEAERKEVVVPRRPKLTTEMTAEELDSAEKEAFLNWRRGMAHLQNKQDITPFERNIEVWRQLWRVLERSDVIVQIVDARNPLLYGSEDLESYVKELGKRNVILVNKADFLSLKQRKHWASFFESVNLPYAFYSAANANEKLVLKDEPRRKCQGAEGIDPDESDDENDSEEEEGNQQDENNAAHEEVPDNPEEVPVLNREELITFLKSFRKKDDSAELFSVGLVGYPNVGKSSTINSLMGIKRTSVSATPGKTKHFQTLFLEQDLLLCDCPGLVMPAFGGSKGEMVLGGILPIDQLTDYAPAATLLAQRIKRERIEKTYGISLADNYTQEDVLSSYAAIRGFMTVRGIPDSSRAARIILKDYVNGKLRYCKAPPSVSQEEFQADAESDNMDEIFRHQQHEDNLEPIEEERRRPPTLRPVNMEKRLDNNFFAPPTATVHYKGKHLVASGITSASVPGGNVEKPWRKHNNSNKKEKLRRVYRHLDVE